MATAISTAALSKAYHLRRGGSYDTLRDTLSRAVRWPRRAAAPRVAPRRPTDDQIWALDRVSFQIDTGEVLGIVGRNGSGKSTLLKILSRITEPTSGRAEMRGRTGALLEVGTGFHPELTGRENVFVNGAILGMRRVEIAKKFDEIVAFADVERFIDTPVKHYSSGMQMRLGFAVAAHLEPDILLVDEVLAVGDLGFQRKCLGKMDDVSRQGRTVVLVSHQMNQMRRLCTRCLWLDAGRVKAIGPTAEVIGAYEASFMTSALESLQPERSPGAVFLGWTLGTSQARRHRLTDAGPVTVRFMLRVDRPVRNAHHGIALYDSEGTVMWGAGTDNLDLSPGFYELVYAMDSLPLKPGPYRWHVNLYENDALVNHFDAVPEMSIDTTPLGHRRDEYAGVINVPYSLSVTPAPSRTAGLRDTSVA